MIINASLPDGIFAPTPRTDDGGASVSQYVGPGLADPIFKDCTDDTPIVDERICREEMINKNRPLYSSLKYSNSS